MHQSGKCAAMQDTVQRIPAGSYAELVAAQSKIVLIHEQFLYHCNTWWRFTPTDSDSDDEFETSSYQDEGKRVSFTWLNGENRAAINPLHAQKMLARENSRLRALVAANLKKPGADVLRLDDDHLELVFLRMDLYGVACVSMSCKQLSNALCHDLCGNGYSRKINALARLRIRGKLHHNLDSFLGIPKFITKTKFYRVNDYLECVTWWKNNKTDVIDKTDRLDEVMKVHFAKFVAQDGTTNMTAYARLCTSILDCAALMRNEKAHFARYTELVRQSHLLQDKPSKWEKWALYFVDQMRLALVR